MKNFIWIVSWLLISAHQTFVIDTAAIYHGSRTQKKIALTFDACPSTSHGGYDAGVVQVLIDSGVPATFFLSGKWIIRHKEQIKKLASNPNFELANHSYSHPHCTRKSADSVRLEIERTESLLRKYAKTTPKLFRPPFGETDTTLERIVSRLGMRTVMYDLASGDPDTTFTASRLIKYVSSHTQNGSIIVMHVNGRGWHTAEALPEIIRLLRMKGFEFVTVSELARSR